MLRRYFDRLTVEVRRAIVQQPSVHEWAVHRRGCVSSIESLRLERFQM